MGCELVMGTNSSAAGVRLSVIAGPTANEESQRELNEQMRNLGY